MKKYKLFGIINIIDLLVLVVIVLAAAFLGTKFLGGSDTEGAPEINITFTTKEVSDFVVDKLADECSASEISDFIDKKQADDDRVLDGFDDKYVEVAVADGCRMYDDTEKIELGKCTNIKVSNSQSSIVEEGVWQTSGKPDYSWLEIKSTVNGKVLDNGVEIGGETYLVGDYVVLRAGVAKIYIEITDIEVVK